MKSQRLFTFLVISSILFIAPSCFTAALIYDSSIDALSAGDEKYQVTVQSFGNYNIKGKKFVIESGMDNIPSNDIEFKEYASLLSKSLEMEGATPSFDEKADVSILMSYNIFDASYYQTNSIPVFGQTGVASSTTTSHTTSSASGTAHSSTNGYAYGSSYSSGGATYGSAIGHSSTNTNVNINGSSTTKSTTTYNPSYGVIGYSDQTELVKHNVSELTITANNTTNADMLFKTKVKIESSSDNIRKIIPYLIYSCFGNIGKTNEYNTILYNQDYFYSLWKEGLLIKPFVYAYPRCGEIGIDKKYDYLELVAIEKSSNSSTVVLKINQGKSLYYSLPHYIKLFVNENVFHVSNSNINLTKSYKFEGDNDAYAYVLLSFPCIVEENDNISLIMQDNETKPTNLCIWENIKL